MSDGFVTVGDVDSLSPGQMTRATVHGEDVAIYNVDGEFYATSDICTHDEAYLSDGDLFGFVVECPLHGARFDVRTGKVLSLPAVYPIKTYDVRVVDGKIQVCV